MSDILTAKEEKVLLTLISGYKCGNEIAKKYNQVHKEFGDEIPPGTLYPLLRRLEINGFIEEFEDAPIRNKVGPKGKYFILSKKGRKALQDLVVIRNLLLI